MNYAAKRQRWQRRQMHKVTAHNLKRKRHQQAERTRKRLHPRGTPQSANISMATFAAWANTHLPSFLKKGNK